MSTLTSVPVRISAEAAAHVEALGLQREMELMIDHMKQTVAGLRSVVVTYEENPEDAQIDPLVVICGHEVTGVREPGDITIYHELDRWVRQTFPPEVWSHFVTTLTTGHPNGW